MNFLRLIDRVESTMTLSAIEQLRAVLERLIAAERAVLLPLAADGASYGGELHAILAFVLDRICLPGATRTDRAARLRVLRDLLVHQTERDEWVMIAQIEAQIGARAAAAAARRFEKALGQLERAETTAAAPPLEARRTGR